MTLENLIEKLNTIDYGILSFSIFIVATALLIFYFIRKAGYFGIAQIIDIKKQKERITSQILDVLEHVDNLNQTLLKQIDLIESFNTDTISEELDLVQGIGDTPSKLICLNDDSLIKEIIFYFSGQQKMLVQLLDIEQESYQFQKEYQQRVVFYNREFEKLKNTQIDQDTLIKYKRDILDELEKIRINVTSALNNLKAKREDFKTEIKYSQELLHNLKKNLTKYKVREIKTKRFYLRYLSFL